MVPRLLPWAFKISTYARCYSTAGSTKGPDGSSGFLSDLMKRIDSINLKTENLSKNHAAVQAGRRNGPKPLASTPKSQERSAKPQERNAKASKNAFTPKKYTRQPVKAKIAVKDHPLSSNMFKIMDEKNFRQGTGQRPTQGTSSGARTGFRGERATGNTLNAGGRPNARPQQTGDRRSGPRRSGPAKRTSPFASRSSATARPASIVPKKLHSAALKPVLSGDKFLYGKPSKFAVSTSTRVAAVAKEFLLESKYPYKLPKSIIDGLDENYRGNKFLLQKNFDLSVDEAHLEERVRKVVRGEPEMVSAKKSATPAELECHRALMENGSLSTGDKQKIYDLVTGVKSAQDLLQNAAWNK